ncbi:MAG: HD domain-containing protein [Fervidicoccaceae archaeon]
MGSETLSDEVVVSPALISEHLQRNPMLRKAMDIIWSDSEYIAMLEMSNVMAVKRLKYNDHGPVHAKIVSGSSLEIFRRIVAHSITPTTISDGTSSSIEEAELIVMLAALLHDIGNSVHRMNHELIGALLSKDLLDRVLLSLFPDDQKKRVKLRQEVMHGIYATSFDVSSLTIEAGCVKVADGTDMSEGRARIPYRMGKNDIHAISALSIEKVTIGSTEETPVVITVYMKERAGVFQIEQVLVPKIKGSGISKWVKVKAVWEGSELPLDFSR